MKKVLALVLAAMMVLAMGVTAFAADDYASDPLYDWKSTSTDPSNPYKDGAATEDSFTTFTNNANSKAFIPLLSDKTPDNEDFAYENDVEGVKLTAKVTEGKEYVSSVALATADEYNDDLPDDRYGILIKFKDYFDIDKETVKVDLTIKSKRGSTHG